MKLFLLCIVLAVAADKNVTDEKDCQCWENFKPEKLEDTGSYYCRGAKNHRIFSCNDEKPPICRCVVDGKTISLDLGETDCLSVNAKAGEWCENKDEFQEYFKDHPGHGAQD